jgi:hypothetical protein
MIAKMNLFGFWCIGVPTGYLLCFTAGMGVFGLWWGLCAGIFAICFMYAVIFARIKWDEEASKASGFVHSLSSTDLRTEVGLVESVSTPYGSI